MTHRYSSVSSLSTSSDEPLARSWSRKDSFSRHILRPWSFIRVSEASGVSKDFNHRRRDLQDSFDNSTLDRPPSRSSEGAWARYGNKGTEETVHESGSAWTRYGDAHKEKGDEDKQFASTRGGWWKEQMLVDRSLRIMAGLTSLFAFIMMIICIKYWPELSNRKNTGSTSVGSNIGQDCGTLESTNVFLHLLINIAATMILGMSNTYQQLVTSLDFKEIRWVLSKHGDSRVGTNSPMNINHKKKGKRKAWLSWFLLVLTSIPIHLLANSVFGQSILIVGPGRVEYISSLGTNDTIVGNSADSATNDDSCWVAFRTGGFPSMTSDISEGQFTNSMKIYSNYFGASTVLIQYDEANCTQFKNTTTLSKLNFTEEWGSITPYSHGRGIANCSLSSSVTCFTQHHEDFKCRISVRMSALITLTVCLIIKAMYMVAVNVAWRRSIKSQCLTFGDVIVASSFDKDARIHNECMLNAGDGNRHRVAHTCHKHCKDREPSLTGESIGHCQGCKKFNSIDKAANLVHPSIAIKYKKSLLSSLGSTATVQMITLMFCSIAMPAVSVFLALGFGSSAATFKKECKQGLQSSQYSCTSSGEEEYLKDKYGTFGGFNSSAVIHGGPNSVTNEAVAFFVANGAQVLYSALYLLLIYNLTLISMELDWGRFETTRKRPRCTIVRGSAFSQSYLLQLPKKVLYPMMAFSAAMHWLLGQAISAREIVYADSVVFTKRSEQSFYFVVYGIYSVWFSTILMMVMTATCWWAFTYTREGFMPQMFGSIRACCAATTELADFRDEGIQWGDLGEGDKFRHAGFSASKVEPIIPGELYCGRKTGVPD